MQYEAVLCVCQMRISATRVAQQPIHQSHWRVYKCYNVAHEETIATCSLECD